MLTVIDVKTGVVQNEEFRGLAPGQVLLKNCTDGLIASLVESVQAASASGTNFRQAVAPTPIRSAKIAIAESEGSCGCGARTSCSSRPSEQDVAVAIKNLKKHAAGTHVYVPSARNTSAAALRAKLAVALTGNADFVEAIRGSTKNSSKLNPLYSLPTTKAIKIALALYAHRETDTTFKASEAMPLYSSIVNAGHDAVRRLSVDFKCLTATGRLAQMKYRVSDAFSALVIKTINNPKFKLLQIVADGLQDEIDNKD